MKSVLVLSENSGILLFSDSYKKDKEVGKNATLDVIQLSSSLFALYKLSLSNSSGAAVRWLRKGDSLLIFSSTRELEQGQEQNLKENSNNEKLLVVASFDSMFEKLAAQFITDRISEQNLSRIQSPRASTVRTLRCALGSLFIDILCGLLRHLVTVESTGMFADLDEEAHLFLSCSLGSTENALSSTHSPLPQILDSILPPVDEIQNLNMPVDTEPAQPLNTSIESQKKPLLQPIAAVTLRDPQVLGEMQQEKQNQGVFSAVWHYFSQLRVPSSCCSYEGANQMTKSVLDPVLTVPQFVPFAGDLRLVDNNVAGECPLPLSVPTSVPMSVPLSDPPQHHISTDKYYSFELQQMSPSIVLRIRQQDDNEQKSIYHQCILASDRSKEGLFADTSSCFSNPIDKTIQRTSTVSDKSSTAAGTERVCRYRVETAQHLGLRTLVCFNLKKTNREAELTEVSHSQGDSNNGKQTTASAAAWKTFSLFGSTCLEQGIIPTVAATERVS